MKLTTWLLAFFSLGANAVCYDSIDETTPTNRFVTYANGTILDTQTRLLWMRCAVGQTWDNDSENCEGDPDAMSWQQALEYAFSADEASQIGWRLPNLKELASLVERRCARPSLNEEIFVNVPADDFWSSTPSLIDLDSAWVMAFYNGSNARKLKTLATYVRLVKSAD